VEATNDLGKLLVAAGLMLVMFGVIIRSGVGRGWLGKLPGDIHFSRGHFNFYFPVVTCIVASIVLTLIFWLFRK
jgi:hypothetical protein